MPSSRLERSSPRPARPGTLVPLCGALLGCLVLSCAPASEPVSAAGERLALWQELEDWARVEHGWARLVTLPGPTPLPAQTRAATFEAVAVPTGPNPSVVLTSGGERQTTSPAEPTPLRLRLDAGAAATLEATDVGLLAPRLVFATGNGEERRGKRILLVVADTLRADAATPELMPELHDYFADGLHFTQAWSPASWTLPSLAGLFTGKRPAQLRTPDGTLISLDPGAATLASELRRQGYRGVGIVANYTVNHENGFSGGFDLFFAPQVLAEGHEPPDASWVIERAREAERWLASEPLFLYLHFMEAHEPYRDHERQQSRQGIDELPRLVHGEPVSPEELERVRAAYRSEVRYLSRRLGPFLQELGDVELAVFTSDHGEEFFEHRGWRHGPTLYPEVVHVPLMIRGRDIEPGSVSHPATLLALRDFMLGPDDRLLRPGQRVTIETFTHAPPRWSLVVPDAQAILFAASTDASQTGTDPIGRWLVEHHPRLVFSPLEPDRGSGELTDERLAELHDEAAAALAEHFDGFRRGCYLFLRGAGPFELTLDGVELPGLVWGDTEAVELHRRPDRSVAVAARRPDPFALLFLPQTEGAQVTIEPARGTPLVRLASGADLVPADGVAAWLDPGRPPAELQGHTETLERLRRLGYIE